MKKFTLGFFLGLLVMFGVGAATDPTLKQINDTLKRIASSMEILANQSRR
jgi:CHASE3 domain sensor protein